MKLFYLGVFLVSPMLVFAVNAKAQDEPSECVESGAMAFDNWTKEDSGGTGAPPPGVQN